MNDKLIEIGDKVKVDFTPLDNTQPYFYGEVLSIPQGTGDMWNFKVGNDIVYVNPSCSRLETIIRLNHDTT